MTNNPKPTTKRLPPAGSEIARFASDYLESYLEAALQKIPEERILEIVEECGAGAYKKLDDFRALLPGRVDFPARWFSDIGSMLLQEGMNPQVAAEKLLVKKNPDKGSVFKNALIILDNTSNQSLGFDMLDLISMGLMKCGSCDPVVSNAICGDGLVEVKKGGTRQVRIFYTLYDEDIISWFWHTHLTWIARYCPSGFREEMADVEFIFGDDFEIPDRHHPGRPLKLRSRPSLAEVASSHGLLLEEREGVVYFGRDAVAVLDECPGRIVDRVYRMTKDVRQEKGKMVIEEPRSLVRSYDSLLLVKDHRYHLERSFPVWNIKMRFNLHPVRHFIICLVLVASRRVWETLRGVKGSSPWMAYYNFLHKKSSPGFEWEVGEYFKSFREVRVRFPEKSSLEEKIRLVQKECGLTRREFEVFQKAIQGKSNRQIAEECFISLATVKSHLTRIYDKTGYTSRSKLIASINLQ